MEIEADDIGDLFALHVDDAHDLTLLQLQTEVFLWRNHVFEGNCANRRGCGHDGHERLSWVLSR